MCTGGGKLFQEEMAQTSTVEKELIHDLVDRLPPEMLAAVIVYLQFLLLDPLDRALLVAPIDDEPETEEERRLVDEARRDSEWIDHEQVRRELGL